MWSNTKCHINLMKILDKMKIKYLSEAYFGRYSIDCYCSDIHVAIEADGWQHYTEKGILHDSKRDSWLLEHYFLPVIHIRDNLLNNEVYLSLVKKIIGQFIKNQNIRANLEKYRKLNHIIKQGQGSSFSEHMKNLWKDAGYRKTVLSALAKYNLEHSHPLVIKNCKFCKKEMLLPYKKRNWEFCNNSCAAKYKHKYGNLSSIEVRKRAVNNRIKTLQENPDIRLSLGNGKRNKKFKYRPRKIKD